MSRRIMRSAVGTAMLTGVFLVSACTPAVSPQPTVTTGSVESTTTAAPTTTTPPAASEVVLSPSTASGGQFIEVIAPDSTCARGDYVTLQATLTMRNGIVLASSDAWVEPNWSPGPPDRVSLRVPWSLAGGEYLVYLSCSNYLDSYHFRPATLTVLPPV